MTDSEDLKHRIEAARAREAAEKKSAESRRFVSDGTRAALRMGTDLVAAIGVGGFLGYWIDRGLGSKPWFMVLFLLLGFAAGFVNIYRSQTGQTLKTGFKKED